ncbi:hypothetical protein [Vreelandella venusta]|uniref:hypothetical protein n=1 Tax=Vreelandella venusta TaxID=44935 RepID=UPI0018DA52B9|nr:hypothetical protein [Halomonas venusta]QPI65778.1 hypothetical protein IR195_08825 [Halomonas venusta]WAM50161.1 hypothetical protein L0521_08180 [Halomonas venusta]WAM57190.1 hypothetical protein L0519_08275 [Halomonas venusta]
MDHTHNKQPSSANDVHQDIVAWWQHYCLLSTMPMVRCQIAWLESVTEAMQLEAELFQAIAKSSEKLTLCLTDDNESCSAKELTEHYQEMVKTLTDANLERFAKVSQLSHEFRRSLWEEI